MDVPKYLVGTQARIDQCGAEIRETAGQAPLAELIALYETGKIYLGENPERLLRACASTKCAGLYASIVIVGLANEIQRRLEQGERP